MSNVPSTDSTTDLRYEDLRPILNRYIYGPRTLESFLQGVQSVADVFEASYTSRGLSPPRSELEHNAFDALVQLSPHEIGSAAEEGLAEKTLEVLSEASKEVIVSHIVKITSDIDSLRRAGTSTMNSTVLRWLRSLAGRATCLHQIGSYPAAIMDCEFGLRVLEQRSANFAEPTHATRMILSAMLVSSKLKMGDIHAPFTEAIENCRAVLASDQASVVTALANATLENLTSTRCEIGRTLRLPLGLERLMRLYGHSPGCTGKFLDLLRELSTLHQYHHVASVWERWVASAQRRDQFDLPQQFAPAPGFPIGSVFDESSSPPFNTAGALYALRFFDSEIERLYVVALLMQDRWMDAVAVLREAAGMDLPFDEYWKVIRALLRRTEGDQRYDSFHYRSASKSYQKSLESLHNPPCLEDGARRLLTTALNYKIGMCLMKKLEHEDALLKFRKCLEDVPDFMSAILSSAVCHSKLNNFRQAKTFYQIFSDKYESRDQNTYPNVRGIVFPNHVSEEFYQRTRAELAKLEEDEHRAHRTPAGPLPPPIPARQAPGQPQAEPLSERQLNGTASSHPTFERSHYVRENAAAMMICGVLSAAKDENWPSTYCETIDGVANSP